MCGKQTDRKPGSSLLLGALMLGLAWPASCAWAADDGASGAGFWDTVLEKLNVKATPAPPAPDFVQRTHPDPAGLGFIKPAVPHKVSPLPVKSAAEVEAKKTALDAAKQRQEQPTEPTPLELPKGKAAVH